MTYLIDSDWIVDWLKNKPDAVRLLRTIAPDGLAISLISVGEIYEGFTLAMTQAATSERSVSFCVA